MRNLQFGSFFCTPLNSTVSSPFSSTYIRTNLHFSVGEFQNRKQREEDKRKTCLSLSPSSPERGLYAVYGKLLIFTRSSRKPKSLRPISLPPSVGLLLFFASLFPLFVYLLFFLRDTVCFAGKARGKGRKVVV